LGQLVRTTCRRTVGRATLVAIDQDRLVTYAATLADPQPPPESTAVEPVSPVSMEQTAATVLSLNAINFGSGYHDLLNKDPGRSGARTIAARWQQHLHRTGPLNSDALRTLTPDRCAIIFGQDQTNEARAELVKQFAAALADLGRFVDDGFGGSFLAVVEEAEGSAQRLAESLLAMPYYRDHQNIDGDDVHFYKRAQISAADLARAFGSCPPANFGDLDQLTAFADNLVPHVLRIDEVLRYDPDLAATIDARQPLAAGSRAEIEIRAAGVEAVERLVAELNNAAGSNRAMDLDLLLWSRGSAARYKAVPRHRARSVFY